MKLIHLSDLHLGKHLGNNSKSLTDDQKDILEKIIEIIKSEQPDGIMIAGDVYDKSIPSEEAIRLFGDFIKKLAGMKIQVYIISGNHDSMERLSFANELIDLSGIHFLPVYDGKIKPFELEDEYGKVCVYMLPFIKPVHIRYLFPDKEFDSFQSAVKTAVDEIKILPENRNVLITHQFIDGAVESDSERPFTIGGTDSIDVH